MRATMTSNRTLVLAFFSALSLSVTACKVRGSGSTPQSGDAPQGTSIEVPNEALTADLKQKAHELLKQQFNREDQQDSQGSSPIQYAVGTIEQFEINWSKNAPFPADPSDQNAAFVEIQGPATKVIKSAAANEPEVTSCFRLHGLVKAKQHVVGGYEIESNEAVFIDQQYEIDCEKR